jgi:hypothetical protein
MSAASGTAPSCCIIESVSQMSHASRVLPSAIREYVIPSTVTCLPVGDMPISSPVFVPRPVQREATNSPSAI